MIHYMDFLREMFHEKGEILVEVNMQPIDIL